jgi:tetratricopeptide (TPR) repeat protein
MALAAESLDGYGRALNQGGAARRARSWYAWRVSPGSLLLISSLLTHPPVALGQGSSLSAAAAASGRPPECSSGSRRALAKGPSVWELARVPNLQKYCDLMARAHAELGTAPDAAKKAAEEADKALPGHAAPLVVIARAALARGAASEAEDTFKRARAIDPRSVEDPSTMHDLARALKKGGKRDEALGVYRALVPRVDLLGTADRRVLVLLEAAHLSMAVEGVGGAGGTLALPSDLGKPKPAAGKAKLDEAIAYLREARQRPATALAGDVLLSLALALDRAGSREEADATLAEAKSSGAQVSRGALDYLATPEDRAALEAMAGEAGDRAAAIKAWEAYLAGPGGKGPWAAAAKARLEAIKKGGGRAAPPAKKGKAR